EDLRLQAEEAHFSCPYDGIPDDAVVEYIGLRRMLSDARKRVQRAAAQAATLRRQLLRPPWPAPPPDQVRREMQGFSGGELIYVSGSLEAADDVEDVAEADTSLTTVRPGSWGVFIRRYRGGPGLVLVDSRAVAISQWADVTRLPEGKPAIDLPEALREIEGPLDDARALLGPRAWRGLQAAIKRLDLPDLAVEEARRIAAAQQQVDWAAQSAGERQGQAAREVADVETAIEQHPCHRCPIRSEHEHALRRETAALRKLAEAEGHAAELEAAAESQAEHTLEALTSVMARFGLLVSAPARSVVSGSAAATVREQGSRSADVVLRPTEKSAVLSRVYDANGLFLTSLVWNGIFEHLAPAELMEVLSWYCYDREGPRWNRSQLTPRLWELRPRVGEALDAVQAVEAQVGLAITSGPNAAFFGPVLAWCRGAAFAELLETLSISEGDLLLALNKTLDLAAQLREALRLGAAHDLDARRLAAKLEVGDRLLRRGIVAQSLRLAAGAPPPSAVSQTDGLPSTGGFRRESRAAVPHGNRAARSP
ncbi:MAG: hypothetical protein ACRDI2_14390, partial [Chloroflexota bacterium]